VLAVVLVVLVVVANRMVRKRYMMDAADGTWLSVVDWVKVSKANRHHHRLERATETVTVTVQDVRCARGMVLLLLARRAVEGKRGRRRVKVC
jgi:hypothetical protein